MLHADALVLTVDASAPPEEMDEEFAAFERFLRRVEEQRGRRTDVGGLPVFLVLTKCDRLARPGDTAADWLERIEQRKRDVAGRFRDFQAGREAANRPPPFGRVHLHLWATAVGRPPLGGAGARPTDPYGVAELFRQGLGHAAAYRDRRELSAHRLVQITLAAVGAVVILLATAGALVGADALRRPSELEVRAEGLRASEPERPAERLRGPPEQLQDREAEWRGITEDPAFAALPAGLQAYSRDRLSELEDYIPWLEKLYDLPRPLDALTDDDLRTLKAGLAGPVAPPRPGWDDTDAGRLRRDLAAEADAMLRGIAALRGWYQDAYKGGDDLWLAAGRTKEGPTWNGWARDVNAWLKATQMPPDDNPDAPISEDPPLTYADIREFGAVASPRAAWQGARARVAHLRDAAAALGLIEGLEGKPPLLVVPANGLTLEEAADRFRQLQKDYPDYAAAFVREPGLPPAAAEEITGRARANYGLLLEPARALVLAKLRAASPGAGKPADAETPERWKPVCEWLRDPKELAGWRGLAVALTRLDAPGAPDPVDDLASFLDIKTFPIPLNEFILVIPDALDVKPRPEPPLKLSLAGGERAFRPVGQGTRVAMRPELEYRFEASESGKKIDYAPGDPLSAELPLAGGKVLRWDRSRSHLYRFEVLGNEPVLRGGDAAAEGRPAEGVQLRPQPENGVPRVPDLLPQVELK
jgi:hypothetical protein